MTNQKYAAIKANDIVDIDEGICVSFWTQGCPHRCKGCHNPETWDFNDGIEFTEETMQELIKLISANGIHREFSILGGEPLCPQNLLLVSSIVARVKKEYPNIRIFLWTGYTLEYLLKSKDANMQYLLKEIDVLIDGPYIEAQRDIRLPLRGSTNQRVHYKNIDF